MDDVLTIAEIEAQFESEWVLVENPQTNEFLEVQNKFVLSPIDDFALEVELLRNNEEFMAYLDELSEQEATISLEDVERELGL